MKNFTKFRIKKSLFFWNMAKNFRKNDVNTEKLAHYVNSYVTSLVAYYKCIFTYQYNCIGIVITHSPIFIMKGFGFKFSIFSFIDWWKILINLFSNYKIKILVLFELLSSINLNWKPPQDRFTKRCGEKKTSHEKDVGIENNL